MSLHVKTGDKVLILAGKDKGKSGKVVSASPVDNTVVVEGVNIITKHNKPRSQQDKGGIQKVAGKIDSSNVQIICSACGKATRIANVVDAKGVKQRTCKKCGAVLDSKFVKKTNKTKKDEVAKKSPAKKTEKKTAEKGSKAVNETSAKRVVKTRTTDKAGS